MRTKLSFLISFILIPLTIYLGIICLRDRKYYFISLVIIFLSMIPFFTRFEVRTIQPRELVLIAVLSAIAVIGRIAFYWLPQFKPVTAIVIISSVTLGAEAGFMVGALTGFLSNFFFGQGPWTPYQMYAFGIVGCTAGLIFKKVKINKLTLSIYGFIATFIIYGGIMNFASILMFTTTINKDLVIAYFISGAPFDFIHALSTVVFLYFITNPMIEKIDRIKIKYGLLR